MNKLALAALLATSLSAHSGQHEIFFGLFAYDDTGSHTQDYKGLSPNGYVGYKYTERLSAHFAVAGGAKHESSTGYREQGGGFDGLFIEGKFTF